MSVDPVVEELAAAWWAGAYPDPGDPWKPGHSLPVYEGVRAILADAGLRERIGAWEPPPDVAELVAEALVTMPTARPWWAEQIRKHLIDCGWTITPPSEGGQS